MTLILQVHYYFAQETEGKKKRAPIEANSRYQRSDGSSAQQRTELTSTIQLHWVRSELPADDLIVDLVQQ